VARATVSILSYQANRALQSVTTGSDGRFSLAGLPAGKYPLAASKPGYRTSLFDEHESFSSAIVTGEGQDTENLIFRIVPSAALHISVVDDSGDPVSDATLLLVRRSKAFGLGEQMTRPLKGSTSEAGTRTIFDLDPGEYYLAVSGHPWYATHPDEDTDTEKLPGNPALDVAFPLTYYDGASDEAAATPVTLAPGQKEHVKVVLHPVRALHLSIPALADQEHASSSPKLRQAPFGFDIPVPQSSTSVDDNGATIFSGLAPGQYEVEQGDPPRHVSLDLSGNQELPSNAGSPYASIHAKVQGVKNESLPGKMRMLFATADRKHPRPATLVSSTDGTFNFPAIPPGRWEVYVTVGDQELPVESTSANGESASGDLVVVRDGSMDLTVNVRVAQTSVEGLALQDGKGQAGAMVVLVPQDAKHHADLIGRDQADSDGSFSIPNVAPGNYTVVAIEDGWQLDWQMPEVLAPYLAHGVPVSVTENSGPAIRLATPVPVQPRSAPVSPAH
jgi:hypothetical protein